jgi:hypothetical protein
MTNMLELNASGSCGINNEEIKNLNLIKLCTNYNVKITDLNHMFNLIKLDISYNSGVDDNMVIVQYKISV